MTRHSYALSKLSVAAGGNPQGRTVAPRFIIVLSASLAVIVTAALLAPVMFPVDLGATDLTNRLLPPAFLASGSAEHVLGTDYLGKDFVVQLFYATRSTLLIAGSGLLTSLVIGGVLGLVAGLMGGLIDDIISFVTDIFLSVPTLIVAIVCSALFGANGVNMALILGLTGFDTFVRIVRGQTMQLKNSGFLESSRGMGASTVHIIIEHLIPNVVSMVIVEATMKFSTYVMLESSLSFIGLGLQPPNVSLGVLVSNGRNYLVDSWWLSIVPSIIIVIIVLHVSIIGDWLRDRWDPRSRNE